MENQYLHKITSKILEMTQKGLITWKIDSSTSKSYRLSCQSDDLTKFATEISLNDNLELNSHGMWWIYIYNKELVEGKTTIYSGKEPLVTKVIEEIYKIYIEPNKQTVDQSNTLNKILNSLDIVNIRDQKIKSIL